MLTIVMWPDLTWVLKTGNNNPVMVKKDLPSGAVSIASTERKRPHCALGINLFISLESKLIFPEKLTI